MDSSSTLTVTSSGIHEWKNERGELHRDDGLPARIYPDGDKQWYQHGELRLETSIVADIPDTIAIKRARGGRIICTGIQSFSRNGVEYKVDL